MRLQQAFLELRLAARVVDDATADAELAASVRADRERPDRDAEAGVPVRADRPDRTSIDAARRGFDLADDLHRPDLRRPGDGAAGKEAPKEEIGRAHV